MSHECLRKNRLNDYDASSRRKNDLMNTLDLLGLCAGTLTTIAFVPQVAKTWRSRSAADISTRMYVIFALGVLLWLLYGVALDSFPIIVSNIVTLMLALCMLWLKYRYRAR